MSLYLLLVYHYLLFFVLFSITHSSILLKHRHVSVHDTKADNLFSTHCFNCYNKITGLYLAEAIDMLAGSQSCQLGFLTFD